MPGQHKPGYRAMWERAKRDADKRLKEAHQDEWERYFAEARDRQIGDP